MHLWNEVKSVQNIMCFAVFHCYVMLCYVMLCYVMLCYVMLCYVMLCYVMLCYVMLCYVMLQLVTISEYHLGQLRHISGESDSSGIGSGDDDVISTDIGAIYRAKVGIGELFIKSCVLNSKFYSLYFRLILPKNLTYQLQHAHLMISLDELLNYLL